MCTIVSFAGLTLDILQRGKRPNMGGAKSLRLGLCTFMGESFLHHATNTFKARQPNGFLRIGANSSPLPQALHVFGEQFRSTEPRPLNTIPPRTITYNR